MSKRRRHDGEAGNGARAAFAAFACVVAGGCTSLLDARDLERAEHGLSALAAETALFVEQFEQGEVSRTFASVHCAKLLERHHDIASDLDDPSPTTLDARADAAREAAAKIGRTLRRLGDALARGAPVAELRREIGALRPASPAKGGGPT